MSDKKEILPYRNPKDEPPRDSMFYALFLCLPGAICWADFLIGSLLHALAPMDQLLQVVDDWWEAHLVGSFGLS